VSMIIYDNDHTVTRHRYRARRYFPTHSSYPNDTLRPTCISDRIAESNCSAGTGCYADGVPNQVSCQLGESYLALPQRA
jgi:hypothetical protein